MKRTSHPLALSRLRMVFVLILAISIIWPIVATSAYSRKPGRFESSGLDGSGYAQMQPVTLGLRVAVVAAVPGSSEREAWAIGRSTAKRPGWVGEEGGGQTVFLKYTASSGWSLEGPPVDRDGNPQNPNLTSVSLTSRGAGWAVGDGGSLVRRDGDRWVIEESITDRAIYAVSVGDDDGVFGFAVGDGPTVLRLSGNQWTLDSISPPQAESWDLVSVSAVSSSEAWAGGSVGGAALILHRTSSGWERTEVGGSRAALFDESGVRNVEGKPVVSTKVNAVAAGPGGAWVGGIIVPVDASSTLGDVAGDPTRPFTIWFPSSGQRKTYCSDEYQIAQGGGRATTNAFCDSPMPLAAFGITSMAAFDDGKRAFAGGLGLFHFREGEWIRERNPISSLSSMGFVSATEGWVAGTGNTYGVGGSVSSIPTLGHWTRSVQKPRVARWPTPVTHVHNLITYPFEAVKLAPDGSRKALAVGQQGATAIFKPEVGWDSMPSGTSYALHGLAWPASNVAWAVGGRGNIIRFNGTTWQLDPASETLTTAALFGVAFSSPGRGYAVGANGTILKYEGGRWIKDPAHLKVTDRDLYAIDSSGSEFVAVGAEGTLLVNRDGNWVREDVSGLIERGGRLPAFYAIDGLSNGGFIAGGELSTLIRRDSGGAPWRIDSQGSRVPPEGTIVALAGVRTSSGINIFASLSNESIKFTGDTVGLVSGLLIYGTSQGWRDLDFSNRYTLYPNHDASAPRDPALSIALDGSGEAWAVGGTSPGSDDGQGHVQAFPTGSIYRASLSGDPNPSGHTIVPTLDDSSDLITFAFFGETGCGRGLCSAAVGSGTKADEVALQIQAEINEMSKRPGGPKFVVFGGNMRTIGAPEELGQFKSYIRRFRIPFFAALGPNDLFGNLQTSVPVDAPDYTGGLVNRQLAGPRDDSFYLEVFSNEHAPWGTTSDAKKNPQIQPVTGIPGEQQPRSGAARTHYAFDYVDGAKRLRIIVIDDSQLGRVTNQSSQNPPEKQDTWLAAVLENASRNGAASIIVMNRPGRNPLDLFAPPYAEANPIQNAAAQVGASAVFTSYHRMNAVDVLRLPGIAQTVPVYVFGGGGAPLDATPARPPDPSLGFYHSWQLVSVSFDQSRKNSFEQAEVYARSFPVLDTLALHAVDGTAVAGGNTLRFTATGRATDGGGPGEPLQSRAAVVPLDFSARGTCPQDPNDGYRPKCVAAIGGPIGPQYQFISENPKIGYFVRPSPKSDKLPQLTGASGSVIPDSTSGLFCAVGVGTTYVNIVSGFHRARMQVSVASGFGPCVKDPVNSPAPNIPVDVPEPPIARAPVRPFLFTPTDLQSFAILVPPTVPIVAPAPPAAGGYARKEEHEEATQTEESEFAALRPLPRSGAASLTAVRVNRYRASEDPLILMLSAASVAVLLSVAIGATKMALRTRARAEQLGSGYRYGGSP